MNDIWPPGQQVPEDSDGQPQRQQQGWRFVKRQPEAQNADHLQSYSLHVLAPLDALAWCMQDTALPFTKHTKSRQACSSEWCGITVAILAILLQISKLLHGHALCYALHLHLPKLQGCADSRKQRPPESCGRQWYNPQAVGTFAQVSG